MQQKIAIAILAAGSSSRLGLPKQALIWRGKALLQHCLDQARAALPDGPIMLTLGHDAERFWCALDHRRDIMRIDVDQHAEGLSASLRKLANVLTSPEQLTLRSAPPLAGVIVQLVDQYRVDAAWLNDLVTMAAAQPDAPILSSFAGVQSPPAYVPARLFNALHSLRGDQGAKALLQSDARFREYHAPHVPGDVDTLLDLQQLVAMSQ